MHLDEIVAKTRQTVEARKREIPLATLEPLAAEHTPRGFARSLREHAVTGPAVIAELKKASPSKGLIRQEFDPRFLAKSMQAGGAATLSVLTDEPFFQGSLRNLEIASEAVSIPCLRKDFMVDSYQIVEARAHRADAILLIAAVLADSELEKLAAAAHAAGLDVLCEVHTAEELERVRGLEVDAVGVNNRDLRTFVVRLETSLELAERLPEGAVRVAESGIHTAVDLQRLRSAGFEAFLIGESLMRREDPGAALKELLDGVPEPVSGKA